MSDLSRSLVDAAAEAICSMAKLELQLSDLDPLGAGRPESWRKEAHVAVLALLDTLAEWGVADEDAEVPPQIRIAVPAFQRIAAEIREARDE